MVAPMAPHIASEMWKGICRTALSIAVERLMVTLWQINLLWEVGVIDRKAFFIFFLNPPQLQALGSESQVGQNA